MKRFSLISALFISLSVQASCQNDQIGYVRESGFSLSIGGKGSQSSYNEKKTVNMPVFIQGRPACYKQKGEMALEFKSNKKNESVKLEISPLQVEFENVPDARVLQYLDVEGRSASELKIHLLTFICSGEIPLGQESYSDTLNGIRFTRNSVNVSTQSVFATGAAARNLQRVPKRNPTIEHFSRLYSLRNPERLPLMENRANVFIPTLIASNSIASTSPVERRIYSDFVSRGLGNLNGCSEDFRITMESSLISHMLDVGVSGNVSLKRKGKSKIELTLTLP